MLIAVTTAPGTMSVTDAPEPTAQPGQALIAVEAVGLCGSDYHLLDGTHPYARFPQTQGHEFAGVVTEFGAGYAGDLEVGQRVAVEPLVPCGACFACRRGRYNCCRDLKVMGAHIPGALAEFVAVRADALHPVGDLDPATAALVEPVSIGLQAVHRGAIAAGDDVVVLGAGPIGLAVTLGAVDRGARVLVADRVPARLAHARTFGAHSVVDTGQADLGESVREWTAGDGAAVVIDATGVPALIRGAFDLIAPSGTIVVVGISDQEVSIPVIEFSRKEVTVLGSRNNAGIFPDAVDLVRRHADTARTLITHTFPLAEVPEAIRYAADHPAQVGKAIITVGPTAS
jgi:L-gulonate 5-dehydrogenase